MGSVYFRKNTTKIYFVESDNGNTLNIYIKGKQNKTNDGGILAADYYGNKLKVKPEDSNISVYIKSPISEWVYIGRYIEHESSCIELGTQIIPDTVPAETVYERNTFRNKINKATSLATIVDKKS